MTGFDYGNTRLRARFARRLSESDYSMLLSSGGLDSMLGRLTDTVYGEEVEAAVARYRGLRRLDEAVRRHLAREVTVALSFYEGPARDLLRLVDTRWDVKTLTALLRGQAAPQGASELVGWLVPAGSIDESVVVELAGQPGVRAMVDLAITWKLPDPATAGALRRAIGEYQATGDTAVLESALYQEYAGEVERALAERPDDPLLSVLHAENLAMAIDLTLRVRAARLAGEPPVESSSLVISSVLPATVVESIIDAPDPETVVDTLAARRLPSGFLQAVERWCEHGEVVRLADDLIAAITRRAVALLREEPLGSGVPVGYLWATEQETRNLRLIGRAHVHGLDPAEVERRLVIL